MRDFVNKRKYLYGFSAILIVISIAVLAVWRLTLGVDFKGGNLLELKFEKQVVVSDLLKSMQGLGIKDVTVQPGENATFRISVPQLTEAQYQDIKNALTKDIGAFEELRFDSVGPTVSKTIRNRAIGAVILVLLLISLYIAYAFRKATRMVSSWHYGLATLIALAHDIFLTIGFYSVYSHVSGAFVDINFIVVLLVVLGFSVHDTIVVFDRIRENVVKSKASFDEIVNVSLNQTLVRSITTSLTTIIVLITILLFAGSVLDHFVSPLIFGIAVGTYSSIFIASALLVDWQKRKTSH